MTQIMSLLLLAPDILEELLYCRKSCRGNSRIDLWDNLDLAFKCGCSAILPRNRSRVRQHGTRYNNPFRMDPRIVLLVAMRFNGCGRFSFLWPFHFLIASVAFKWYYQRRYSNREMVLSKMDTNARWPELKLRFAPPLRKSMLKNGGCPGLY